MTAGTAGLMLGAVLLLMSCGGSDDSSSGTTAVTVSSDADASGDDSNSDGTNGDDANGDDANGDASGDLIDGSSIDWATVDLKTIDWVNIDLSTLDFSALEDNPSAGNLDADTVALIQARMAERAGSGRATLTIGDETWEFEGFVCAIGFANTESEVFSLSTNAFGVHSDGTRVQMQADIWDNSGEDRITGPDLDHSVSLDDIEDFDNPVVSWEMINESGIVMDGNKLTAEGLFSDGASGQREIPGRLDAECGLGSRI